MAAYREGGSVFAYDLVVTNYTELSNALRSPGEKTVLITNSINFSGYIEMVPGANVTLISEGGVTLRGSTGRMIEIPSGAALTIGEDASETMNFTNGSGYVFLLRGTGELTMNGGSITNSRGGVILDSGGGNAGVFVMNGGEIADNNYGGNGAAVNAQGGGSFTMNGGAIHDNVASGSGGGVYVDNGCHFIMNGGAIYNNTAGSGGAIGFDLGTITLNSGAIYNNRATSSYGGAISTGGRTTVESFIYNSVIYGNAATGSASRGGGLYSCGAGALFIDEDATAILGNRAAYFGDQIDLDASSWHDVVVPRGMLGGTDYSWYYDRASDRGHPKVYLTDSELVFVHRDASLSNDNALSPTNLANYNSGINSGNAAQAIAALQTQFPTARVFIFNNQTTNLGGGIGGNGLVHFSVKSGGSAAVTIYANKSALGAPLYSGQFEFGLYDQNGQLVSMAVNE